MPLAHLACLAAVAVAACSGGAPASPARGGVESAASATSTDATAAIEAELRYDQTIEVQELELRWLDLRDSRCPIGVNCFWAGEMVATVEVARGEDEPVRVELVHRVGREPERSQALGYELWLLGVDPHPREGVTPKRADYVARIQIVAP